MLQRNPLLSRTTIFVQIDLADGYSDFYVITEKWSILKGLCALFRKKCSMVRYTRVLDYMCVSMCRQVRLRSFTIWYFDMCSKAILWNFPNSYLNQQAKMLFCAHLRIFLTRIPWFSSYHNCWELLSIYRLIESGVELKAKFKSARSRKQILWRSLMRVCVINNIKSYCLTLFSATSLYCVSRGKKRYSTMIRIDGFGKRIHASSHSELCLLCDFFPRPGYIVCVCVCVY